MTKQRPGESRWTGIGIEPGGGGGAGPGRTGGGIDFIVTPGGTAFPAYGAKGPFPTYNKSGNNTGVGFSGSSGGSNGQVFGFRIMNPVAPNGNIPGYPNGYIRYFNKQPSSQAVDPYSGKTVQKSCGHYPID